MVKNVFISAATVVAVMALGATVLMASAAESNLGSATAASVRTLVAEAPAAEAPTVESYPEAELSSEAAAKEEGERAAQSVVAKEEGEPAAQSEAARAGKLDPVISLLKKSRPLFVGAVNAAKQALRAGARKKEVFENWVNGLSNLNPAKWAIKALQQNWLYVLIDWLSSQ